MPDNIKDEWNAACRPAWAGRSLFGDAVIQGLAGNNDRAVASVCRFDIDRDAVRIWPLG
jgi:hypothetical protein